MLKMKDEGAYCPQNFEDNIYKKWEKSGYFKADEKSSKPPFSIVMPPPNVTSKAHIGHALDNTLQDILIRYKRMQGFEAVWLPGTDHAAIATEHKIVEKLASEGKTKEGIGREAFDKEAWAWYDFYGNQILNQFKKMGCSADWGRYRFTMDEKSTDAVLEAFIKLYKKGYIYRGTRQTNFCVHCKSVISDDELVYSDDEGSMWHIKYPFADGSGNIVIATTRPETLFGDTAVAVNPDDERYKSIVGKTVIVPLQNREIPIIADKYVEKDFGTGMVKITPAHDPNDYEVGKRHNLEVIEVITKEGVMSNIVPQNFRGLGLKEAREMTVRELEKIGALEKIEPYTHSVAHCEKCKSVIEPLITEQWFVKMSELVKPAIKCVENGSLKIHPKRFEKNYLHWLRNIRDWCISRQLWTGHRIPIYYCKDCGNVMASKTQVEKCSKCGGSDVFQDPDVLDTWFSSSLWPLTTLGYPKKTKSFEKFYPTSVLVTAYDILTQWVTKMVYMGIECGGDIPFKHCLIHGLIRDEKGRKMSKSLGNGIDPLEIIDKYGADTLRIALIKDISMGIDSKFSEKKIEESRTFINKVWNAGKFLSMHSEGETILDVGKIKLNDTSKWLLCRLEGTKKKVCKNLDKFDIAVAFTNASNFTLDVFCDWAIELFKPDIFAGGAKKTDAISVLSFVYGELLKMLHPFIPFVTEYIFERTVLFDKDKSLMISSPSDTGKFKGFSKSAQKIENLINLITALRKFKIDSGKKSTEKVTICTKFNEFLKDNQLQIEKLACVNLVNKVGASGKVLVVSDGEFVLEEDSVDSALQKKQLEQDIEKIEFEINRSEKMLSNSGFIAKAPASLIESEKTKLEKNTKLLAALKDKLGSL